MYAPPKSFHALIRDLTPAVGSKELTRLLVNIELTLSLARQLGFESEPLTVGWALLSRMPLYHPLFNTLSAEQRRMWANAALIVPLSSRFAWENALVKYAKDIPLHLRLYAVQPLRLDDQMIALCRQEPCLDPTREAHYESILYEKLPYIRRKRRRTKIGKPYKVYVMRPGNTMRWLPYDRAAHQLGVLFSDERARLARRDAASALRLGHEAMLNFVHEVLTKRLERPTLAVIEKDTQYDDIAFKHPQIIEMVPFFIHPDFQSDEGQRQLCRCVHFLRISPAFTSGDIMLPYPMHLGEKLIEDQLVILGADS